MSFSVDDLVASLSGSHIGQEAMDLATLQSQLAQTLFSQQVPAHIGGQSYRRDSGDMQPCNTPTSRTRSSSLSFGQMGEMSRSRSNAIGPNRSRNNSISENTWGDMDEMDEDEAMVEDLVTPSSPMTPSISMPTYPQHPSQTQTSRSSSYTGYSGSPSSSYFASTDPFYLAQLQALQNPQASSSVFAQAGHPAQHSPFMQHAYNQTAAC